MIPSETHFQSIFATTSSQSFTVVFVVSICIAYEKTEDIWLYDAFSKWLATQQSLTLPNIQTKKEKKSLREGWDVIHEYTYREYRYQSNY